MSPWAVEDDLLKWDMDQPRVWQRDFPEVPTARWTYLGSSSKKSCWALDLADDPARPACCKTPWSIVLVRQEAVWGCFGEFGHVCRLHGMFWLMPCCERNVELCWENLTILSPAKKLSKCRFKLPQQNMHGKSVRYFKFFTSCAFQVLQLEILDEVCYSMLSPAYQFLKQSATMVDVVHWIQAWRSQVRHQGPSFQDTLNLNKYHLYLFKHIIIKYISIMVYLIYIYIHNVDIYAIHIFCTYSM